MKPADKSKRLCAALARVLHEARESRELSQTQLAALSGLTRQMISYVEKSERIPTVDTIARLAIAMKTTPAALLELAQKEAFF